MRVLVCGGREFSDTEKAYKALNKLRLKYGFGVVIEGDARGADKIAGYWARRNGMENLKYPADWNKYGNKAGIIRNQKMLDEGKPDLIIAFPGGKGTADMKDRAKAAGLPIYELFLDEKN